VLYDQANRTENVEIETEEKVEADKKCPCVLHRKVKKNL
jgi:hypothetical protein